ncbi:MAG: hypothetical protein R3F61_07195 [Myxococcota bacterium]
MLEQILGFLPMVPWWLTLLGTLVAAGYFSSRWPVPSALVAGAAVVAGACSLASSVFWLVILSSELYDAIGQTGIFVVSAVFRILAVLSWGALLVAVVLHREDPP